ncbi:MAG: DUF4435 domain-containing protein [Paramuribaculum sp.]|nr:DUF4435 domain-containing protein [Paramuribaculum sp.]
MEAARRTPLIFPPHLNGLKVDLPGDIQKLIIVGSNGAGKTRFTAAMAAANSEHSFPLSALTAIFDSSLADDGFPNSLDTLYVKSKSDRGTLSSVPTSGLGRLLSMLMQDELTNLLDYKLRHAVDSGIAMESTRLDTVIRLWHEIFPQSKVFLSDGKLCFTRAHDIDAYPAARLSPGEKAVIYYIAAMTYAPSGADVYVESPELFLHPTVMQGLWNRLELLRPDCRFIYTTHDLDFAASRSGAPVVWVRDYDPASSLWDYQIIPADKSITDEIYMAIVGARKPVLFIEGDGIRSIDSRLYPLVFKDYTVQSLGSCNKVIEATRTFNDLNAYHQMSSYGIVDRDRREIKEVEYLRGKRIMVPEVAEIENILMLEDVIAIVAASRGKDVNKVLRKVRNAIFSQFRSNLHQQALLHTRHKVKRTMEYRVDAKFDSIRALEEHINHLVTEINPRRLYENFCKEFYRYLEEKDYASILRVYNQKSMITTSNVVALCGFGSKDEYVNYIVDLLRSDNAVAENLRKVIRRCFNLQ